MHAKTGSGIDVRELGFELKLVGLLIYPDLAAASGPGRWGS